MLNSSSQYQSSCKVGTWYPHCVPNGEEVDAIYPSTANYLELASRYYYYSPVLVCPDAQRDGVFTSTRFQYQEGGPTSFPTANFPLNALTSVLAPAETAVAYSPSGFSANLAHGCYSYFPVIELAGRTGCLCRLTNATHETATRTFDCFGETTTQTEDVLAAVTSETIGREPFTFTADEWEFAMEGDRNPYPTDEPLQGMALAPFILMVNGGGDGGAER
ncbi:hypothetical protein HYQ45_017679 [Verticillium longisporum]|uniref:Uncharacterized protein n=1 Tax=Verticillium longisporum TaxID=100787 RepID=A0A8I2Z6A2_VERLO|nr:hypothetical protein HYQ45_017679 [Verticillium longisporum]